MKYRRTVYLIILAAVLCISFSSGFLIGRRTAGGTYTILPEKTVFIREDNNYDIITGGSIGTESIPVDDEDNADIEDIYININTCDKDQLMLLPSIGETRAISIIDYRNKNGPFRSVADIMQVNGIGESIYDKIEKFIYIDIQNKAEK